MKSDWSNLEDGKDNYIKIMYYVTILYYNYANMTFYLNVM